MRKGALMFAKGRVWAAEVPSSGAVSSPALARACSRSGAEPYRRRGSFSRHRITMVSSPAGTGRIEEGGGGSSFTWRYIVATGVSVNVALLATVIEGVNRAYQVVVPRDAVAGVGAEYVEAVLDNTIALLATLTTTQELVDLWSK